MLSQLTPAQRALADCMSQLSEQAHAAGWIDGLEHALWHAVVNGPTRYGRFDLTRQHIDALRQLSAACGGWIVFDEAEEETFVPMDRWLGMFAAASPAPPASLQSQKAELGSLMSAGALLQAAAYALLILPFLVLGLAILLLQSALWFLAAPLPPGLRLKIRGPRHTPPWR